MEQLNNFNLFGPLLSDKLIKEQTIAAPAQK